jgi:hypothetical protein
MFWLAWVPLILSVGLNLASFTWQLYGIVWWYDKVVHTFTAFAFTLPLPLLIYRRTPRGFDRNVLLLVLIFTSVGLGLGAIWEITEWGGSQLWGGPTLREGRRDVITDLIVDAVGALLGAWAGKKLDRRSS